MTKLGGGVDEFEVDLLLGTAAGLDKERLAQGQNPLLGSDYTAFNHQEVVGHLTIVHKATLNAGKKSQFKNKLQLQVTENPIRQTSALTRGLMLLLDRS